MEWRGGWAIRREKWIRVSQTHSWGRLNREHSRYFSVYGRKMDAPTGSTREYEFISNEKRARKKERVTQFSKNVDTNEICRPSANKNESMKCQDISSAHTSVALRSNRECLDIHCVVVHCSKTDRLCCNNVCQSRPFALSLSIVHLMLDRFSIQNSSVFPSFFSREQIFSCLFIVWYIRCAHIRSNNKRHYVVHNWMQNDNG